MQNLYMIDFNKNINSFLRFLARNELFCILLSIFIIILIIGTLAQKDIGIQLAQEIYFESNIIWINIIPIPGGKFILIFIFINLITRLLIDKWKKKKTGTLILHFGIIVLLFGAFVSNKYNKEGIMILKEGCYSDFFINKSNYELIFENKLSKKIYTLDINKKKTSDKINLDGILIEVSNFKFNCELNVRNSFFKKNDANRLDRFFLIKDTHLFIEQENNKAFLNLSVNKKNVLISILEYVDKPSYEDAVLKIFFVKKKEKLPFKIFLTKFDKINYPGTKLAESYQSFLIINMSDGITWKYKIEMNKPFRFMGYTFYQTSFLDDEVEKSSILTVVKNSGSIFPYLSIIIIFIGFLLHIFLSIKRIFRY